MFSVATDGSVNTDENTPLKMKLNASDPDNDPLTYIIDTQPSHGSISVFNANNGTLTYTPQSNFTGQDSLKFKVNDGTSDSNVATVLINVKNVNHSPIAEDQNVVTNINKQIEITLKGPDPDPSDKITFVKVTDPGKTKEDLEHEIQIFPENDCDCDIYIFQPALLYNLIYIVYYKITVSGSEWPIDQFS